MVKHSQTLLVALLDGCLDERLDFSVGLKETVLETTRLLKAHPQNPRQTFTTYTEKKMISSWPRLLQHNYTCLTGARDMLVAKYLKNCCPFGVLFTVQYQGEIIYRSQRETEMVHWDTCIVGEINKNLYCYNYYHSGGPSFIVCFQKL